MSKKIRVNVPSRLKAGGKIWDQGEDMMPEGLVSALEDEGEETGTVLVERLDGSSSSDDDLVSGLNEDQVAAVRAAIATLGEGDLKDGVPKVTAVNKALKAADQTFAVKAVQIAAVQALPAES